MVAVPTCHVTLKAQKPSYSPYPASLTTIGDHLKKKRLDMNLFQKDVAYQIGVTEEAVYNWENNRSKPKIYLLPKIIEFLGYVPFELPVETIGDKIIAYRKEHGLSQRKLAELLAVDKTTIRDWERNIHRPCKNLFERINKILV
jgi:DNA-binding XRE family transcriptional regulator